jgi:cytochrome d ubiquinol oxidase subunit I
MGRQPWVVYGQMFTRDGVSPLVGPGLVITSMTVLGLLYLALAVVEVGLIVRYAKAGPPEAEPSDVEPPADGGPPREEPAERPMQFAY